MGNASKAESEHPGERRERQHDVRSAVAGGAAAALIGFAGMVVVGTATAFEARRLLDAVLPTARFAASAYVAGGATILALMLTLITFSISNELEFREGHYKRIREISGLTTIVICASVLLLMFLSFPLGEADVDRGWYLWVYYAVLLGGAATGGVFITIMLMLYYAIRGLVSIGQDPEQSALVITDDRDGQ